MTKYFYVKEDSERSSGLDGLARLPEESEWTAGMSKEPGLRRYWERVEASELKQVLG